MSIIGILGCNDELGDYIWIWAGLFCDFVGLVDTYFGGLARGFVGLGITDFYGLTGVCGFTVELGPTRFRLGFVESDDSV